MRDIGISSAYACALVDTMNELMVAPRVSSEVARRAQWLKWALEGYEPGTEPLEFIADSPPIAPTTEPPVCSPALPVKVG
jgi:hypothetical protein